MNKLMLNILVNVQNMLNNEEGQDLVEYGLVVALVAFGAVAAMHALGTEISTVFADISSTLASSIA